MKKALWNALVAGAIAAGLIVSPSALAAKKKTPTPAADADSKSDKTEKVNLNTASEKEIAAAKGVSDKLAKELVKNRPYRTWDDVSKVKGVGSGKKLDSLKKVLKLSGGDASAKEETAAETKTMGKKSSASKSDEGNSASTRKTPEASSPSKKSSSSSSSEKLAPGTKFNINTASAEELERLPEIGPVKAQAIVDYRKANGRFTSIEDIMKVSGIKEGTFAMIRDYIVVR